jgi:hypothetical protein
LCCASDFSSQRECDAAVEFRAILSALCKLCCSAAFGGVKIGAWIAESFLVGGRRREVAGRGIADNRQFVSEPSHAAPMPLAGRVVVWLAVPCSVTALLALGAGTLRAEPRSWDSGGANNFWINGLNWNPDGVPTSTTDVTLGAGVLPGLDIFLSGAQAANSLTIALNQTATVFGSGSPPTTSSGEKQMAPAPNSPTTPTRFPSTSTSTTPGAPTSARQNRAAAALATDKMPCPNQIVCSS